MSDAVARRPVPRLLRSGSAGALPAPVALLAAVGLALLGGALMSLWSLPPGDGTAWLTVWELTVGAGFTAAGLVMASTRTGAGVAWPMVAGGLALQAGAVASGLGAEEVARALTGLGGAVVLPLALVRLGPRRPWSRAFAAGDVALVLAGLLTTAAFVVDWGRVASWAASGLGVVVGAVVWLQFEISEGDARRRVLWLVYGLSTSLPLVFLSSVTMDDFFMATAGGAGLGLVSLLLPGCAALAAVAPLRWDVRSAISRSVVAVVMLTLVVSAYAGAAAVFELFTQQRPDRGLMGLVVAVIAAGFHPVMVQVRRLTEEVLFGGRADAVQAMTGLGSSFAAGSTPQEWVGPLRAALAVPAVELRSGGETVAAAGTIGTGPTVVTPLRAGTQEVGELVVALPDQYLRLPAATLAVLQLVAGPLAQALYATRLSEQVQASRGRVVAALEEERRRVRRDLHDGLGPTLTGIAYSADAAANLVRSDPGQTEELLTHLRADATEAIAEIRRIVRGLRPKALDELGLAGAVRQQVQRMRTADGRPMRVSVEAGELPLLPAAVEVVAYRVAVEAATNVARHAGVAAAEVIISLEDGRLVVTVTDGGVRSTGWTPGVGLDTMRERVESVGGALTLGATGAGGRVRAELPLP